jgi:hypothetical protein
MRTISDDERKSATIVVASDVLNDVDDTEAAFNEFRESFHTGEEPGTIRAWELAIDERGTIGTTKTQIRLGTWPIDAYKLDELCQLLIDQYMSPDKVLMAVRLVGTDPKKSGYVFNKIMMLKRALKKETSSAAPESTATLLKAFQEMSDRNLQILQRMQPVPVPVEKPDTMAEMQKMMVFAQSMNAPMLAMMQTLLPALVGRPVPAAADPFASVTGLIDVVERLSDLRGGGDSGGGNDDSIAGIIRSIVPVVKPTLEALPALAAMQARAPARIVAPARAPQPAAGTAPASATDPTKTPTPQQATPAAPINQTDIPSGDSQMLAQLKPQIDSLVQMAEQGSDATGAADLIFDQVFMDPNVPEEIYEKLANFVDSDTFVKYVLVMNPAAKTHAVWFEAFKAQIVKRLDAEEPAPGAPTAPLQPQ